MTDPETDAEPSPEQLVQERRAKADRLREQGIDPFPHSYPGVTPVAAVHEAHDDLEAGAETDQAYRVAGRLTARRGHGKAAFLDLVDRSGRIQLHARRDVVGEESLDRLLHLDLGDLIGIDGTAFKSRRGELSLRVDDWQLLAKSLRPPPEKFHGLEDVETRYRQRELDLMANEETRDLFILRSKVIAAIRRWLDDRGFLEVETPILQPLYGGALARPFTTHHNQLGKDLYLRIATELYLKRLIVGGLERVYEIGKNFRNEGVSHKHNPEFTVLEWYEAYKDYTDIADELEELTAYVAGAVGYDGEIDFTTRPWRRVTLRDAILEKTGVDVLAHRDTGALVGRGAREGHRARPDRGLAPARRRPALEVRRARPQGPDVHHGLPDRAVAARQEAPVGARPGRALRVLRRRDGVRQRVLRAERPGRPARPVRGAEAAAGRGPRGDPALRRGLRARARARHAPGRAGSASASTGW